MDRLSFVLLLLLSLTARAEDAQIIFTPRTPVAFTMTKKDISVVSYNIRNNTGVTKKINLINVKGMKSLKGDGFCGVGMVLLPKKECILNLQLKGAELAGSIYRMPMLCEADMSQCYLPEEDDQMDIILKD